MKHFILIPALLISVFCYAQSLPFNFEGDITTENFVDFDGGTATVISNPQSSGSNTSATVAQIVRDGGTIWSGSKVQLDANLNFSENTGLSMKVWTTAPVGTQVKFKLEGNGETERDAFTTVSGEWETLTWDFTGAPADYDFVVFMFDFNNVGDGSANSTFLFDDVEQVSQGEQLDWPVTFDDQNVNYTVIPFEGNSASVVVDPTDANNMVMASTKTINASPSAGTTIGTNAGFATNIPLTLDDSRMSVRVWSPAAGVPVRLKVEDANDVTHTCETETNTTLAGEWETLVFDFVNQAPGTELLEIGLNQGWVYNKASIFFNFATGYTADEPTYYCDDLYFGVPDIIDNVSENQVQALDLSVYPNPAHKQWNIDVNGQQIEKIELYSTNGQLLLTKYVDGASVAKVDAESLASGTYYVAVHANNLVYQKLVLKE